jgi:hypothetical protein
VPPIAFCITWNKISAAGAISGAIAGLCGAIITWICTAKGLTGVVTIDSLGGDFPMLAGNLVAIGLSTIVCIGVSAAVCVGVGVGVCLRARVQVAGCVRQLCVPGQRGGVLPGGGTDATCGTHDMPVAHRAQRSSPRAAALLVCTRACRSAWPSHRTLTGCR